MQLRFDRIFLMTIILIIFRFFVGCSPKTQPAPDIKAISGTPGIDGAVVQAESGNPLPARIVIRDEFNDVVNSYYDRLPGFFTSDSGQFSVDLTPGNYNIRVFYGIEHVSQSFDVTVADSQRLQLRVPLQTWVDLQERGWVNGYGHAHLYTGVNKDSAMLDTMRMICRAQDVDFVATNQGWAGYGDDNWREAYAQVSDSTFWVTYGAEMPKYRTGHTWWLGLSSTYGYFEAAMDSSYENQYYKSPQPQRWTFDTLPMPNVPAPYMLPYFQNADTAVAIIPHPTSWWWDDQTGVRKYVTNVCEYLPFAVLAGGIWDGMVVMGYNSDHYFYQNLWFAVLNRGVKMPPIAELDGGYGRHNKFPYGRYRTYYHVGDSNNIDGVADAVRKGRTFVTSGPIVLANIDEKFETGQNVPADGESRTLNIEAWASGAHNDFLSYLVVFRNGEIYNIKNYLEKKPRHVRETLEIKEDERSWYVIKAYGRARQPVESLLDVPLVCDMIAQGRLEENLNPNADVCITSPFYFGEFHRKRLASRIKMKLVDPLTGMPAHAGYVEMIRDGEIVRTVRNFNGELEFTVPVNTLFRIVVPNYPTLHRGLYLDYKPHQRLVEELANGDWLEKYNMEATLQPGQVPPQVFPFEESYDLLREVEWTIPLERNERDRAWEEFLLLNRYVLNP